MPVTKQNVLDAVEFFGDNWELPESMARPFERIGDWLVNPHFAVRFSDVSGEFVSSPSKGHQAAFDGFLVAWKSGEHRVPVKAKRGEFGIWRDRKRHETCVQGPYAELLRGLDVARYDGPGLKGSPLLGLASGDPVVVVMPYLLPGAGGNVQ